MKVPFRKPAVALFLNRSLVAEANFSGINLMPAASEKIQPAEHNLPENIKLPDAHESCKAPDQPPNCSRFIVYTRGWQKSARGNRFFRRKVYGPCRRPRFGVSAIPALFGWGVYSTLRWKYSAFHCTSWARKKYKLGTDENFPVLGDQHNCRFDCRAVLSAGQVEGVLLAAPAPEPSHAIARVAFGLGRCGRYAERGWRSQAE